MRVIVTDANVLINLAITDHLALFSCIDELEFVTSEEVLTEVTVEWQRERVNRCIADGHLSTLRLESPEGLEVFADLRRVMGLGEASCLALAETNDWGIASDEKGVYRRVALARLGEQNLLTTVDIYVMAIKADCMTIEAADAAKVLLAEHRFKMGFDSFGDFFNREA